MDTLDQISKQYLRTDLPVLQIGDKVEVIAKHFIQSEKKVNDSTPKFRLTRFGGTVIAQRNPRQISYTFCVLKDSKGSDKLAVRSTFSYHSPLIVSIKIKKKVGETNQKVRRGKLYYLERELARKKDNE